MRNFDDPGPHRLRAFGVGVGLVAAAMAALGFWRPDYSIGPGRISIWAITGTLAVLGVLAPQALTVPYRLWMTVSGWIGSVMTTVLLAMFFLLVLTPVGLVRRVLGSDPLGYRKRPPEASYWHAPDPDPRGPESYKQPF